MSILSLFSQSLVNEKYIFFDVETTGLFPLDNNRVIEIAMIKTEKGNIVDTIDTMINPGMPIPEDATRINHITDDMVADAPYFDAEFGKKMLNFMEGNILIAHNAAFDLGFVSVELGRQGLQFERWRSIDTLKIANRIFPGQKNKLESLMRRYNILPEGDLHRAFIDTDGLRRVFFEFLEETEIRSKSVDDLVNEFGFEGNNLQRSIPASIREAIVEKKNLKGVYRTRTGETVELSFLPISPVWVERKWFLLAQELSTETMITLHCKNFLNIAEC